VKLLCDLNYRALNPSVRGVFDQTERWEMERQQGVEAEALKDVKEGRDGDAVALLQQFINANCERVGKEYRTLNQTLPETLSTAGVNYLYTDYLKAWTSQKGVPLP
jgi:hypothetical protein